VGCLIGAVVLVLPRTIMVVLWIFTDYLSTAFGSWVWPLLGFFLFPTTTLAYAVAENRYDGAILDLGALGSGRGLGRRLFRSSS
jgi:hypothetical protein